MAFSDPQKIISELNITEGSVVADLGAGSGFYSLALSEAVGAGGKVYAVDIQQELLTKLKSHAIASKLHNIDVIHGNLETLGGTRLKDGSIDLAIIANVLFQIEDKNNFIEEVKRILKSGARIVVVDWQDSFGGMGPHPENVITQADAKNLFEKSGFEFAGSINAGDHHYGLILRKK